MKIKANTKALHVFIPQEQKEWLQQQAKEERRTITEIVKNAIDAAIEAGKKK